jgi:hypothetical protein
MGLILLNCFSGDNFVSLIIVSVILHQTPICRRKFILISFGYALLLQNPILEGSRYGAINVSHIV